MEPQLPSKFVEKYRCRWRYCSKNLHNLETLRRHVLKVHKPEEEEITAVGGFVCWWRKCEHLEVDSEGNVTVTHMLGSFEDWARHIQDAHIYLIAVRYGDGPPTRPMASSQITKDRQRFLSDGSKRIVTPDVTGSEQDWLPKDTLHLIESHPETHKATPRMEAEIKAQKSFFKVHGIAKDKRKQSEEIIRALAARKDKIGPGIDRGGCTLVNEARRSTFVQNPGIRRMVDRDY